MQNFRVVFLGLNYPKFRCNFHVEYLLLALTPKKDLYIMISKRELFYKLNPYLRFLARRLYYFPSDLFNSLTRKRNSMEPPKGLIYTGYGDFIKHGELHLKYLCEFANLKPEHHVLDIGSGIGRSAVALTKFINSRGSFEGFDVIKIGVDWCKRKITSRYPNFKFQYIDLKN